MKKELHGTAKYLHQIYKNEGGPEKHDDSQQSIGILKLAGILFTAKGVKRILDKIEHLPIKALEKKDED